MRSLIKLFFAAFLMVLAFSASTAYACGCGIYVPRQGDASVAQERALVRWDGQRQDIVMSLGVLGKSQEAAIILPVPARADVKLGDANLFDELAEMTKPLEQEQVEWTLSFGAGATPPEAAGALPGVNLLSRQSIGPFDVANLAATDTNALKQWLDDNGFQLDAPLIELMQPYVDEHWTFVAVRLRPGQSSQELSGSLQPLSISFDSAQLVYPMRASAHAKQSETLLLYVLADHRIDKANAFGASEVSYAGWVEPSALAANSALTPLISRKFFLTKFTDRVDPKQVNDDFRFSVAAQDTPFRQVTTRIVKQDALPFVLLACFLLMILGAAAFVVLLVMVTRRRMKPA